MTCLYRQHGHDNCYRERVIVLHEGQQIAEALRRCMLMYTLEVNACPTFSMSRLCGALRAQGWGVSMARVH